jgi:integrase/recombinase XerD
MNANPPSVGVLRSSNFGRDVTNTGRSVSKSRQTAAVTNPTALRWMTYLAAEGIAANTIDNRRILLNQVEREIGVPINEAASEEIANWLARSTVAPATKAVNWSMLNSFFNWMVRQDLRTDNPMTKIRRAKRGRRRPRPCSRAQFTRLIEVSEPSTKAMFLLAGLAGLRGFEIAKFHSDQIDVEAGTITVLGKGDAEYTLPAHIQIIRHAMRMPRGFWFPSREGPHVGRRVVWQRMRLQMIACQVPGTPHTMRHYFATELVRLGVNLRIVQELMRHASLQTTQVYTLVADDQMRAAIDKLAA